MALQIYSQQHYVPHGGVEDSFEFSMPNGSGGHHNILAGGVIFGFNGKTHKDLMGSNPWGWTSDGKTTWRFAFVPDPTTDYPATLCILYDDAS